MSSTATPKKTETASKTTDATKAEPMKTQIVNNDTTGSEKASDKKTSDKKPQSASQSSISHFSSVSTPEYRQGWDQIFGTSKNTTSQSGDTKQSLPEHLLLTHKDIDRTLQNKLNKAFRALAQKEGYDIEDFNQLDNLRYKITCELIKQ